MVSFLFFEYSSNFGTLTFFGDLSNLGNLSISRRFNTFSVNSDSRHVYVGIETGQISYYQMSDDLNVLESIRTFNAHNNCPVLECIYCPLREWIFSIGGDGTLVWSDVKSGNKLGNYSLPSKPRCFQVPYTGGFNWAARTHFFGMQLIWLFPFFAVDWNIE